jgi:hypothetical protein
MPMLGQRTHAPRTHRPRETRTLLNRAPAPAQPARAHHLLPGLHHSPDALMLQRTIGNHAVRQLLQRDDASPDAPPRSKTIYMGMNKAGKSEADTLKGILKDDVILAMNDPTLEKSLATNAGIATWLLTATPDLISNPFKFLFAYLAIEDTMPAARDQMAQVIQMFHLAEIGKFRLERLVLSGHSNGVQLWGDEEKNFNPGSFLLEDMLTRLTAAFPAAAAQVEDVMFSACYTVSSIDLVVKVFPNVQNVWGYAGLSPAAGAGAEAHISRFERETRGGKVLDEKDGLGKSALWTREAAESSDDGRGYIRNDPAKAKLSTLKSSFYGLSLSVNEQIDGSAPLNQGILNQAYFYVQMMLAHPELREDDRNILHNWRDVLLRLRHYEKVCANFASTYAAEIKKAYDAIKRATPNYAKMSRAALTIEKSVFEATSATSADAKEFYDKLLLPFYQLDRSIIPETWI